MEKGKRETEREREREREREKIQKSCVSMVRKKVKEKTNKI